MDRMKTFLKYLVAFVICYFLVSFLSFCYIRTTYKTIECVTKTDEINIDIEREEATYINGIVRLKATNNTQEKIQDKYIRINFYSEENSNVGSKYIKIDELNEGESIEREIKFNFIGIQKYDITLTDTNLEVEQEDLQSDEDRGFFAITAILVLICFGAI